MSDNSISRGATGNGEPATRKQYESPAIVARERLESAANVCSGFGTKSQPGQPSPFGGTCGQTALQS